MMSGDLGIQMGEEAMGDCSASNCFRCTGYPHSISSWSMKRDISPRFMPSLTVL